MTSSVLTDDERAYVVDYMIRGVEWGLHTILDASTDQEAAQAVGKLLGNSGFAHLVTSPGPCPRCGRWGERDEERDGWFCDTDDCDLSGQHYAEITHQGWTADSSFAGAIVVTETPRLGRMSLTAGRPAKRNGEAPTIPWMWAARYLRAKHSATGAALQTSLF